MGLFPMNVGGGGTNVVQSDIVVFNDQLRGKSSFWDLKNGVYSQSNPYTDAQGHRVQASFNGQATTTYTLNQSAKMYVASSASSFSEITGTTCSINANAALPTIGIKW